VSDSARLLRAIVPLLNDPVKAVHTEAAYRLSTFRKDAFNGIQYALFRKALDEYKTAQEYVADFPTGRYNLGNYYSRLNEFAKAEENYEEAITIDNLFYPAKINLAILYYKEGKSGPAENLFNDLIRNHPELQDGFYYLGLLYGEQKRYTEAISMLETASAKSGSNPRVYYNLGLLYQMTEQNAKCTAAFEKGLRLDSCNFDLLYALFAFHMKQNNRTEAGRVIGRLRTCYPNEKSVQNLCNDFLKNR
jgi:tetratricopeptide (TPR) repeat protein